MRLGADTPTANRANPATPIHDQTCDWVRRAELRPSPAARATASTSQGRAVAAITAPIRPSLSEAVNAGQSAYPSAARLRIHTRRVIRATAFHAPMKAMDRANQSNTASASEGCQGVSDPIASNIQLNGSLGAANPSPSCWKLAPACENSANQLSDSGSKAPPLAAGATGKSEKPSTASANANQIDPLETKP